MPKPTYKELWNREKFLEKENQGLSQTVEMLKKDAWIYQNIIESVNSIIMRMDPQGNVKYINAFGQKFFGYSEKEILGKNIIGTIIPLTESSRRDLAAMIKALGHHPERYINNENEHMQRDGQKVLIAWINKGIQNEAGNISEILCVGNDISQRRQTEEALVEKEAQLRTAIESLPFDFFALDETGRYIMQNSTCKKHWGNLIGRRLKDVRVAKDTLALWQSNNRRAFAGEVIESEVAFQSYGKEGFYHNIISPIYDGDRIHGILGVNINITKRKKAEQALQESEKKFRSVTEQSPNMVFINNKGRIVYCNRKCEEIMGYTIDEFCSPDFDFFNLVSPESTERVRSAFEKHINGKEIEPYEYALITKDGRKLDAIITTKLIQFEGDRAILGIVTNITQRKKMETSLRESEQKLSRAKRMEAIGLMAAGIAHDLNNILSGIVGYPDLILMDLPENNPLRKPIEHIRASGNRAAAVVSDLLAVARGVATGKEILNINSVIEEYIRSAEHIKLETTNPTITFKFQPDHNLLNTECSSSHIKKSLLNLVTNATEAIQDSGTVIISTMNRYLDKPLKGYEDVRQGEYAVLTVYDDGLGLSTEDLDRIFEPFYTKKIMNRSGTGLGLTVVWNTVQDNGGYVNVVSDEDGTIFELYFPITRDQVAADEEPASWKNYAGNRETILVIDDEKLQREIACGLLIKLGYSANAVSSGEEAIGYLKTHSVDLIVLDMIMYPGMNGRKTYERIITIHPNQKAIIASGFSETEDVRAIQKLGAGKYIRKPLTLETLANAVKEELNK